MASRARFRLAYLIAMQDPLSHVDLFSSCMIVSCWQRAASPKRGQICSDCFSLHSCKLVGFQRPSERQQGDGMHSSR